MPDLSLPRLCGARLAGTDARCQLDRGHRGLHTATLLWPDADEAPTAKLPPIRDRILPRPPAPAVRELKGAELLRALADELRDYDDADDEDGR